MSPDPHHNTSMAWEKFRPSTDTSNLQNQIMSTNGEDKSTKRFSINSTSSDSSSPSLTDHVNGLSRKNSKSKLLDRIKYFEGKTHFYEKQTPRMEPVRKESFRKVINDFKAQYPEEYLDDHNEMNSSSIKRASKESNSPRLSYNETNRSPPQVTKVENQEVVKEPARKLSVKETINETIEHPDITAPADSSYLNSSCAQFFATSDDEFLLKTTSAQKQFKVIMKGSLYHNSFYPQELAGQHMRYYIHDFFDYDLSPFEYD